MPEESLSAPRASSGAKQLARGVIALSENFCHSFVVANSKKGEKAHDLPKT
jgi:hypothetical protein